MWLSRGLGLASSRPGLVRGQPPLRRRSAVAEKRGFDRMVPTRWRCRILFLANRLTAVPW